MVFDDEYQCAQSSVAFYDVLPACFKNARAEIRSELKVVEVFFYQCEDDEILLPFFLKDSFQPVLFFSFSNTTLEADSLSQLSRWLPPRCKALNFSTLKTGGVSVNGVTGDSD